MEDMTQEDQVQFLLQQKCDVSIVNSRIIFSEACVP